MIRVRDIGDGALHPVWENDNGRQGRAATMKETVAFMRTAAGQTYAEKGYRAAFTGLDVVLAMHIGRSGPTTLLVRGVPYSYAETSTGRAPWDRFVMNVDTSEPVTDKALLKMIDHYLRYEDALMDNKKY